jgi:predicted lipoprotein with Yx(FWY)xxD motif
MLAAPAAHVLHDRDIEASQLFNTLRRGVRTIRAPHSPWSVFMRKFSFLIAILAAYAAAQAAAPALQRVGVLADDKGMTLYVFTRDGFNASNCYDGCAKAWPPFLAPGDAMAAGEFSIAERKDGTRQWAFKGQPLYYFAGDAAPGDRAGDGSGSVWFVVRDKAAAKVPAAAAAYPGSTY